MVYNKSYAASNPQPTANIAVNKNRLKVYEVNEKSTVYLKDRQTFQIEVYNPTQNVILAEFYINGTRMPGGGLILKPAERVFLDRYLTEKRKLMFQTYVASGSSEEVARAIVNNGNVEVKFYSEYVPFNYGTGTITTNTYYYDNTIFGPGNTNIYGSNTTLTSSSGTDFQNLSFCSNSLDDKIPQTAKDLGKPKERKCSTKRKSVETGRVEKGGSSKQEFQYEDRQFQAWAFHTAEINILPISQKVETSETVNARKYCTECGTKASRKGAKFCSECGTRL